MTDKERPKSQLAQKVDSARQEMKKKEGEIRKKIFAGQLEALLNRQGGHIHTVIGRRLADPGDPRKILQGKAAGKHGGFKKWEIQKIWAPKLDAEGKPFVPKNEVSPQQIRRQQLKEANKWMNENYPGEDRRTRRKLAKARLKNFRATEKSLNKGLSTSPAPSAAPK
jgi:hypothetical protein